MQPEVNADSLATFVRELIVAREGVGRGPVVLSISGPPGSGKSTLSREVSELLLSKWGLQAVGFSTDDLYLTRQQRISLAQRVHPLFLQRGVPGSHDISMGMQLVQELSRLRDSVPSPDSTFVAVPRFDKAIDDRAPVEFWPRVTGRVHAILIDSWFWRPQLSAETDVCAPLNQRERDEDPDCSFRRAVRDALLREYPAFFDLADYWIALEVESWKTTVQQRIEQELQLLISRGQLQAGEPCPDELRPRIEYFLALFERWAQLPRAQTPDLVLRVDETRRLSVV